MIYITGATGFIGSRVARGLLARGDRLRCLVRSRERGAALEEQGAELLVGDVADVECHARGLESVRGAIHLAAAYDIGTVDRQVLQRANVEGTRAFLSAAERADTPRVVYISTTAALGPATGEPGEPRVAYDGPYPSEYHRTKAEAHRSARAAQQAGQPIIIVCPAFAYGPGDAGPAGSFVRDVVKRRLPVLLSEPAWFSYVFVDDVADGIIAALDRGTVGEVYILSGEESSVNDYARRVAQLAGVKPPPLRLPYALARWSAMPLDWITRLLGLRLTVSVESVQIGGRHRWLHTHERATRDLDYHPRPLGVGLPETVQWTLGATKS